MTHRITVRTAGRGLQDISSEIEAIVLETGVKDGLCTVFVQHTSASLLVQENADPTARHDLQAWLDRLVPEGDAIYTHTAEGLDDMPSHIKAMLTATTLGVPITDGCLALGRWQGIYLFEHRRRGCARNLVIHIGP